MDLKKYVESLSDGKSLRFGLLIYQVHFLKRVTLY